MMNVAIFTLLCLAQDQGELTVFLADKDKLDGDLEKAHEILEHLDRIFEILPELAKKAEVGGVEDTTKKVLELIKEMDDAVHANRKEAAVQAYAKIVELFGTLKK